MKNIPVGALPAGMFLWERGRGVVSQFGNQSFAV